MKNIAKGFLAVSVLTVSALGSVNAIAEFSGNIGATSNYVWRGLTQSNNGPAISGGLDYANESGFYVGTWTSSIDWSNYGDGPAYELDLYAGFGTEVAGIGLDIGAIQYMYPIHETKYGYEADFNEVYVGASWEMLSAKYSYSSDFVNSGDSAYYFEVGFDYPLAEDMSLGLHAGKSDGDFFDGGFDYMDYSVSLSKGDFTFAYMDTDLSSDDSEDDSDYKFVVSWGTSF